MVLVLLLLVVLALALSWEPLGPATGRERRFERGLGSLLVNDRDPKWKGLGCV